MSASVALDAATLSAPDEHVPLINPTLKKKVQKLIESNTTDEDFTSSLRDLSTVCHANTLSSRWHLRDGLERRVLYSADSLLSAFSAVEKLLDSVKGDVESIQSSCLTMDLRLQETERLSGRLIQQAESLFRAEHEQRIYHDVSVSLLGKFQLTSDEIRLIKSPDVSSNFFQALSRAVQIQSDCQCLLRLPDKTLGSQLSTAIAHLIETSSRKIYSWVLEEVQHSFERDTPEVHPLMPEAVASLQERTVLFNSCLEAIGMARNRSLVRAFIEALTQGGPNGVPKPIEIHASDPRRYVGDMSAWLHQTLAGEQELAASVFRLLGKNEGSLRQSGYVELVLSESFKDVCRPFRVRVDQVLSSPIITPVTAFYLSNTFFFYSSRFAELAGRSSPLVSLADQCRHDAVSAFQSLFVSIIEKARQVPSSSVLQDLSPSRELLEVFQTLREVEFICSQSLLPDSLRVSEFSPLLDRCAEMVVDVVRSNSNSSKLTRLEEAIYSANSLHQCSLALTNSHPFSQSANTILGARLKYNIDTIAQEQVASILRACGMATKLASVIHAQSPQSPQQKLSELPGMDAALMQSMFRSFETSLLDLGTRTLPLLGKIESAELRSLARTAVAKMISEAYSTIYYAVMDPKSGYSQPETFARYKPDQISEMIDM